MGDYPSSHPKSTPNLLARGLTLHEYTVFLFPDSLWLDIFQIHFPKMCLLKCVWWHRHSLKIQFFGTESLTAWGLFHNKTYHLEKVSLLANANTSVSFGVCLLP